MTTLVQMGGELCSPVLTLKPAIIRVDAPTLPIGPNFNLIKRLHSLRHPSRALSQIGGLGERLNLGASVKSFYAQGQLITANAKATITGEYFDMFVVGTDDEHPDPYNADARRFQFRNGVFTWKDEPLHPKTKARIFFDRATDLHFVYAASAGAPFVRVTEPRYVQQATATLQQQSH